MSDAMEFHFHTKLDQTILLGQKAKNAAELLGGIKMAPKSSIYYHTHHYLQQHHYLSPEPPNDFAYWITEVMNDAVLGERLSSIDISTFMSITELQERLIKLLSAQLKDAEKVQDCPPGQEFHFMGLQTFVLPTPHKARDLAQFREILTKISISSLYYHMFDAKLRLEKGGNDFSRWFSDLGKKELAEAVTRLDPYTQTLEGLRKKIITLTARYDTH